MHVPCRGSSNQATQKLLLTGTGPRNSSSSKQLVYPSRFNPLLTCMYTCMCLGFIMPCPALHSQHGPALALHLHQMQHHKWDKDGKDGEAGQLSFCLCPGTASLVRQDVEPSSVPSGSLSI
jgi:hypothetical protein